VISSACAPRRPKIEDPNKPKGVFMLVGPSGSGKTETALALGDLLFGGEQNVITINMSEFQEAAHGQHAQGIAARATWATARAACSPRPVRRRRTRWCCSTRSRRRTPTCSSCSSRCSTRGVMEDGEGAADRLRNTIILLTTNAGPRRSCG
jgi:type VI secretion system protein VasG